MGLISLVISFFMGVEKRDLFIESNRGHSGGGKNIPERREKGKEKGVNMPSQQANMPKLFMKRKTGTLSVASFLHIFKTWTLAFLADFPVLMTFYIFSAFW